MRDTILCGDALEQLRTLPDNHVQTVCTSPPYYNLRDYQIDGQIGLESTPDAYIARLVEVFREVKRVLRSDGTCWVNIGDSYAGSGKGHGGVDHGKLGPHANEFLPGPNVSADFLNCFQRIVKGQPLIFGDATTIRIAPKRGKVALDDNGFPYGVLLRLLGIERVTIKQRDNNFCQVFHILNDESYCWIGCPVASCRIVDMTDLEIVFDAMDSLSIVISNHNTDTQPVLGIPSVMSRGARKEGDSSLPIEEASKPVAECIRDIEPIGDTVTFDTALKRFPDIYLVDKAVALGDRLDTPTSYSGNFRITHASREQFGFSLEGCGVDIRSTVITHMFAPNSFGSLVHYTELYDKAKRMSNCLRPKQLLGIPDLLKRALMEDGWICRSSIIWHKPNAMPESVTDRPTSAHEHVFLLAKSASYFYDQEAIREAHTLDERLRGRLPNFAPHQWIPNGNDFGNHNRAGGDGVGYNPAGRNKRNVWTIASQPYSEAHFATFPPKLVEPCILAGTSPRACEVCGAAWERVTERESVVKDKQSGKPWLDTPSQRPDGYKPTGLLSATRNVNHTTGWQPTCTHANEGTARCIVLDPFCGAGTTPLVALQHNRSYLGVELNPDYCNLIRQRIAAIQPHLWSAV